MKANQRWTGYVVYDANSNPVLATYGRALMAMAFNTRDEIASSHPGAQIMAEKLDLARQPHVGDVLSFC
jgi:hypothetical protein